MKSFINDKTQKLSKAVLSNIDGLSYSAVMKLIRSKDIKVNSKRVKEDLTVIPNDQIVVYNKTASFPDIPQVFSNDDVLVVDKPSGITSENLYSHLQEMGELYFVHRLDRNTSGIMIFARNKRAETELLLGFKTHTFDKIYHAKVYGVPAKKEDVLTAYLVKDAKNAQVKIFDKKVDNSVQIKTGYKVLEEYGDTSLLEVKLYTGKTHQIRAHLSHIGHFIVGDGKYGNNAFNKSKGILTQQLKAHSLTLNFKKDSPLYYLDKKTFKVE